MTTALLDQVSLPRDPAAAMEAATKQYVDGGLAAKANTNSLGGAAYQPVSAFATAAQGARADSAVQPGTNPTFGNVTVTGAQSTGYVLQETGNASHVWQFVALSGGAGIWNNSLGYTLSFNYASGAAAFIGSVTCVKLTQTSDADLKTNVRRDRSRYRGIRRVVEMVLYDLKSGMLKNEPGVLAQDLLKAGCHADDFVSKTDADTLAVDYSGLALACATDPEQWA